MVLHESALIAGRYRVERQIGAGGMGSVWLATDTETGQPVALKQAHPGQRPADREVRIARDLRHPRIVAQYDAILENGQSWLVMQYVPSRDLAAIIAADGPLRPEKVAHIGRQLVEALQVLHAKGVVHGDVSPGNVLITDGGDAMLTDFGVARAIWSDATITAGALVAGTPAYLAPEVARGEERTPASDVFSLGATLFAAAEGVSPLGDAENPLTAVWRSASGHIASPTAGPLGSALARMLRVEPGERPDAAEAGRLLGPSAPTGPPHRPKLSRTKTVVTAVVVVVAALGLITGGLAYGFHRLSAGPKHPAAVKPPPRPGTIGDAHTADPCALLRPSDLARYGHVRLVTDYGGFNRCDVLISKDDTDIADAAVNLVTDPAPEFDGRTPQQTKGVITTVSPPEDDGSCDRFLLFPDGNFAVVNAKPLDDGKIDTCAAATAVANHATTVLNRMPVPRLPAPRPATSLANLGACGLLDPATLAKRPGFGHVTPDAGFGNWGCDYSDDSAPLEADVRFDRNTTLTADENGRPTRIGGRPVFVRPDDPGTCLASIVYRPYRNADGDGMEEIVNIEVDGDDYPQQQLCTDATALATAVVAKLPHVS